MEWKFTRRKAQPQQPQPQPDRIAHGTTTGTYSPIWQPLRPGADQHEQIPSRRAAERVWRDGRREPA